MDLSPLIVQGSAFSRLRKQLREAGERLFFVEMDLRAYHLLIMLKETGTIMLFDDDRNTFFNSVSDNTLDDLDDDYVPWPRNFNIQALTNYKVQLPAELRLFPG